MKKLIFLMILSLFLMGCGGKEKNIETREIIETIETMVEKSIAEIYEEILNDVELPVMITLNDNYISNYYGVDLELIEEYFFANAEEIIYADTIIILKAKNEENMPELQQILETIISQKKLELENYLPEQFKIVDKSKVKSSGNYVYLVMSDEENKILEIIEKYID